MPFLNPLHLRWTAAGDYDLLTELRYRGRHELIAIEPGFRTDLASVPRVVRWLLPSDGRWTRAAILHDWCCHNPHLISARDGDGLFRRVCREEGVPVLARWLLWTGVRYGSLAAGRREQWWRDAPAVAGMTLLAAPIIVPASVVVLLGLGVYAVAELVVSAVELASRPDDGEDDE